MNRRKVELLVQTHKNQITEKVILETVKALLVRALYFGFWVRRNFLRFCCLRRFFCVVFRSLIAPYAPLLQQHGVRTVFKSDTDS